MDNVALGSASASMNRTAGYQAPTAPRKTDASVAPAGAVQPADASKQSAPGPVTDQLKQAVEDINKSLKSLSQGLEFSIDADSKQTVVKVIDPQTKEVIRQMPTEEALAIAKALDQALGKLIKAKA